MTGNRPNADDLGAKVFQDREHPGNWRVEKMDEDGLRVHGDLCRTDARQRVIDYARYRFGEFDEIELPPYGG